MYHSLPSIHNKSAAESNTIKYYIHYFNIAYSTLVYPLYQPPSPKINCLTIVFHFSCVSQLSQEKVKTMVMQNFGR